MFSEDIANLLSQHLGTTGYLTSMASAILAESTTGNFMITTAGFPAPTLSESGMLPGGLMFQDNGNGTAGITGMPSSGTNGSLWNITITANNGIGNDVSQSFVLPVGQPSSIPGIATPNFLVGQTGTFPITTNVSPAVAPHRSAPTRLVGTGLRLRLDHSRCSTTALP